MIVDHSTVQSLAKFTVEDWFFKKERVSERVRKVALKLHEASKDLASDWLSRALQEMQITKSRTPRITT